MRTSYVLRCACGARVPVTSVQAGETLSCPQCGNSLAVPTLRDLALLEVADQPRRRARPARWDTRKMCMMWGLYVALGALVVLGVLWLRRPEPPDPAQLTLLESWHAWMALRQGLNRQISWYTYQLIEAQRSLRIWTIACLTLSALGAVVSLLAFLVRKRRVHDL
jgi:hypothetical protein